MTKNGPDISTSSEKSRHKYLMAIQLGSVRMSLCPYVHPSIVICNEVTSISTSGIRYPAGHWKRSNIWPNPELPECFLLTNRVFLYPYLSNISSSYYLFFPFMIYSWFNNILQFSYLQMHTLNIIKKPRVSLQIKSWKIIARVTK